MGARAATVGILPVVKEAGETPGTTEAVVAVQTAAGRMQTTGRAPRQVGEQEGQATQMLAAEVAAEVATTSPIRGDPRLAAAAVVTQAAVVEDPVPAISLEVAQVVEVVAPRGLVPAIFLALLGFSRFQAGPRMVKEGRVAQDAQVLTVLATLHHPLLAATAIWRSLGSSQLPSLHPGAVSGASPLRPYRLLASGR